MSDRQVGLVAVDDGGKVNLLVLPVMERSKNLTVGEKVKEKGECGI